MLGLIAFARPLLLLLAPAVLGLLVYAYLRKGRQDAKKFGTLLFLKDFHTHAPKRSQLVIPPRFYLELATLLLLLAAAGGLFLKGSGERVAIVYDNSLSTGAVSTSRGVVSQTLYQEAQDALSQLPTTDTIDLYVTNAPHLNQKSLSPGQAESILYHVEPAFGGDDIERVLSGISSSTYSKIIVISDRYQESGNDSGRYQFLPAEHIKDASTNIAIEKTRIKKVGGTSILEVTVRSFVEDAVNVRIQAESVTEDRGSESALSTREAELMLEGQASKTVELPLPEQARAGVVVTLKFQSDFQDQLPLDNTAYASVLGGGADEILFVGDLEPEAMSLQSIKRYSFKGIKPSEYEALNESHNYRAAVFHRYTPQKLPNLSALFIFPNEQKLFPTKGSFSNLQLSRWMQSHAITNYLNLSLLSLPQSEIFKPLPWQEVILSTPEGAALLAGEKEGKRYAVSGFELLPFRGKESPFLSVLTLNLLTWIEDAPEINEIKGEGANVEYMAIRSEKRSDNMQSKKQVPGLYSVKTAARTEVHSVNFYNEGESNLKEKKISISTSNNEYLQSNGSKEEVLAAGSVATKILALIVFAAIIIDMLYLLRRKSFFGIRAP